MDSTQAIEQTVEMIVRLFRELAARGIRDQADLWFLHSKSTRLTTDPLPGLFASIVASILALNPTMLSETLIVQEVLYGSIAIALWFSKEAERIEQDARERVQRLAQYTATRDVDVPVQNLEVGPEPFRIGPVLFAPISDADRESNWWQRIASYAGDHASFHVVSYGRVNAPGDSDTAIRHALAAVERAVILLRAIGFPITPRPIPQLGILTDHPLSPGRPLRLAPPIESIRITGHSTDVTVLGPPTAPYRLHQDLLASIDESTLQLLIPLIHANFYESESPMKAKFMAGLRWLGEATKPDIPEAALAKLTFSLESLIGGEASEQYLTSRGLTATLAERAAFLVGENLATRQEAHRTATELYGLRSDIVHGRAVSLAAEDLPRFGAFVRNVAWALVRRLTEISTVNQLQSWTQTMRYS